MRAASATAASSSGTTAASFSRKDATSAGAPPIQKPSAPSSRTRAIQRSPTSACASGGALGQRSDVDPGGCQTGGRGRAEQRE